MDVLSLELQNRGTRVWYDNKAKQVTEAGMKEGVANSAIFLLFLSAGCLQRDFVQLEIREAIRLEKPVMLLHETDTRHGAFNFQEELAQAPEDIQEVVRNTESLPWRRRGYEREAMFDQIFNMSKQRKSKWGASASTQSAGPEYSQGVASAQPEATSIGTSSGMVANSCVVPVV